MYYLAMNQKQESGIICVLGCVDNYGWNNENSPNPKDCNDYATQHCFYGYPRDGHENMMGEPNNYPENNCCACGKARAGIR